LNSFNNCRIWRFYPQFYPHGKKPSRRQPGASAIPRNQRKNQKGNDDAKGEGGSAFAITPTPCHLLAMALPDRIVREVPRRRGSCNYRRMGERQ